MMSINNAMRRLATFVLISAVGLTGCMSYQLGTTLPKHLRSISVDTFNNRSDEPNIETTIASAVMQEFQRDGQLKIKDRDEADIVLSGVISDYRLAQKRADSNSPKKTSEYEAYVTVNIVAVERTTGKKIVSKTVTGKKIFSVSSDIMTAKRNSLPDVAKDLSKNVVDAVISAW